MRGLSSMSSFNMSLRVRAHEQREAIRQDANRGSRPAGRDRAAPARPGRRRSPGPRGGRQLLNSARGVASGSSSPPGEEASSARPRTLCSGRASPSPGATPPRRCVGPGSRLRDPSRCRSGSGGRSLCPLAPEARAPDRRSPEQSRPCRVLDGAAIVGHARHRAVPLRLERFEARLHSEAVAMSQGHVAAVDHRRAGARIGSREPRSLGPGAAGARDPGVDV
jgi:hypothetical protein